MAGDYPSEDFTPEGMRFCSADPRRVYVDESKSGRKYWSPKGMSVLVTKPGRHRKTAVIYGAISDDGEQLFELRGRFNTKNFVRHLESSQIRWKKAVMIMDNAKQHSAKMADWRAPR